MALASAAPPSLPGMYCPPGTLICGNGCLRLISAAECPADSLAGRAVVDSMLTCDEAGFGELCEADGECGTRNDFDNCETESGDPSAHVPWWDIYQKVHPDNATCADAPDDSTGIRLEGTTVVDSMCSDQATIPACEQLTFLCGAHPQVRPTRPMAVHPPRPPTPALHEPFACARTRIRPPRSTPACAPSHVAPAGELLLPEDVWLLRDVFHSRHALQRPDIRLASPYALPGHVQRLQH